MQFRSSLVLTFLLLTAPAWAQKNNSGAAAPRPAAPAPAPRAAAPAAQRQNPNVRQNAPVRQNFPNNRANLPNNQNLPNRNVPNNNQNMQGRQFGRMPQQQGQQQQGAGRQFGNVNNNNQGRLPNNNSFNNQNQRGTFSRMQGGGTRETRPNGSFVERNSFGRPTGFHDPGRGLTARMNPNTGRPTFVSSFHPGSRTEIHRGPLNERRVEALRSVPGGVERISHYGNWASVQRPMMGRPGYVQRTVFVGGGSYNVVYHSYGYHGVMLYRPVPAFVFAPAYYGYLGRPWGAPVVYSPALWGWSGQPWYQAYGPAFAPYPVYNSPDQWITDYLISSNLQRAYDNQMALTGQPPQEGAPMIGEEEKALINQDVRNELARQQQFAANPTPPEEPPPPPPTGPTDNGSARNQPPPRLMETPVPAPLPEALQDKVFNVYVAPLEVQQPDGTTCNLAEGDLLIRTGDQPNDDNTVDVVVRKSHASPNHPEYCAPQTKTRVALNDLQEMYNHKKELIAEGVKKHATLMGKGLPKGPAPQPTVVARGQVDPDTAAAVADLKKLMQEADSTEKEVSVVSTTAVN